MDLDIGGMPAYAPTERVMSVLASPALSATMRLYGVRRIVPPAPGAAKPTETVQRFEVHPLTTADEDPFTKVAFSRRGSGAPFRAEAVSTDVLARHRMPPLVVPHYAAGAAARRKVAALLARARPQARDIFDLRILTTRLEPGGLGSALSDEERSTARSRIYAIDFEEDRDAVLAFLAPADQAAYDSPTLRDDMRLNVLSRIEEGR